MTAFNLPNTIEITETQRSRIEKAGMLAHAQAELALKIAEANGWSKRNDIVAALITAVATNYATLRVLTD